MSLYLVVHSVSPNTFKKVVDVSYIMHMALSRKQMLLKKPPRKRGDSEVT